MLHIVNLVLSTRERGDMRGDMRVDAAALKECSYDVAGGQIRGMTGEGL